MAIKRRNFLNYSALATAAAVATNFIAGNTAIAKNTNHFTNDLKPIGEPLPPITVAERQTRIAKAQRLLVENKMQALLLESGTSLEYFTGISWGASERTMVAIIPVEGDICYVCPAFEEDRFRERITNGKDVYVWQEDESPYKLIAKVLKDAGISSGIIGIEERVRFFIVDGVRKAAPQLQIASGDPITIPCRIIKSANEIALMQRASDITIAAIAHSVNQLQEGMSQRDLSSMIMKTQAELGGSPEFALCLMGKASAFPHGTKEPQKLKKGDIVLMDCGCSIHGYNSDITRTIVFGAEPTKRQEQIWNLEKQSQAAGFAAAKIGAPCGDVDAAARKVITDAGFGPGYALPGLPHRTGHGIGMDGHEWGNMLKGNKLPLQAGMCFSIEPTIAIPGEFGVRFEDCVYMTETGPKWFTHPPKSIKEPFG